MGAVLVVGGGIGGIQASLDLAELGFKVYIVEKAPSIGGVMAQLDKTFPTNDCSMCILAPKMVEVSRNPNIEILSYTEIVKLEGQAGDFKVIVVKKTRYVDEKKCKNCGICSTRCPIKLSDEFNQGLMKRSAIYIPFPQAVPPSYLIDSRYCLFHNRGICRSCQKSCEAKAIDFEQKDELITLNVGAIILSTGVDTFDAISLNQYGYKRYRNVITSLEFERILNASGPYEGHVLRPSDNEAPHKILWISCIGSRNCKIDNNYCSSVCCMYSIKEATIAKEHAPELECYFFNMDVRAVGKGFEEYYVRAKELGIKFVKTQTVNLEEDPINNDILVTYENLENNQVVEDRFDLVILSIGYQPSHSTIRLNKTFGIRSNKYDFCLTHPFNPLETSKKGIYVCGTLSGPKDIPETVAEASGAAAEVSTLLASERNTLTKKKIYPPETYIISENPRIGVFICHCGINIGAVVNVPEVLEFAKTLPNVVHAEENLYTCSQDTQDKIKQIINKYNINRVVVASCTPRTHETLFQNTIREAGLNKFLFELVNIREQCSWVHMSEPLEATAKAKELIAMSIAKVSLLKPLGEYSVPIVQSGLVIGGGIAGMTAALELANQGFQVYLIEKEKELGGLTKGIHYLLENEDPQKKLAQIIEEVQGHEKIVTLLGAEIESISGFIGQFKVLVNTQDEAKELETGTIIVATGGREYKPSEYLYGQHENILTQQELEQKVSHSEINVKTVAMIQCVGSRTSDRPYCSRICCNVAIKNALRLKILNPEMKIIILHKDIRTYGFAEEYYQKARELGIIFIRFKDDSPPQVEITNNQLQVTLIDSLSNNEILIEPDLLVLSAATIPNDSKELSHMLKVPLDQNGFFLEAHVKLRPLDFATDGIFLCGIAQFPKMLPESIAQAKGAAARAATILSKDAITISGTSSQINADLCIGCGSCLEMCPYNAIRMRFVDKKIEKSLISTYQAHIIDALCKGCGTCASICPVQAIYTPNFTNSQILTMVESITKKQGIKNTT